MSDHDIARIMPIYRDVKSLATSISSGVGIYRHATQLQELMEAAISADGSLDKVRAGIGATSLATAAKHLAEQAEAIKAQLDAL